MMGTVKTEKEIRLTAELRSEFAKLAVLLSKLDTALPTPTKNYDDKNELVLRILDIITEHGFILCEIEEDAVCDFFDGLLERHTTGDYSNYN